MRQRKNLATVVSLCTARLHTGGLALSAYSIGAEPYSAAGIEKERAEHESGDTHGIPVDTIVSINIADLCRYKLVQGLARVTFFIIYRACYLDYLCSQPQQLQQQQLQQQQLQ